ALLALLYKTVEQSRNKVALISISHGASVDAEERGKGCKMLEQALDESNIS
ncbi:hypothetical protein HAX54_008882, partial [Datura stramonium]|nr:hypothetical protein [Datura stramonium]